MTNTEMLFKLRAMLDEASAELYVDATDLYGALSDAQLELCNVIALSWYEENQVKLAAIPRAIQPLITTKAGTIATPSHSFILIDIIRPISIQWNPESSTIADGKYCVFTSSDGAFLKLLENSLLSGGHYSWWDGALVFVNPPSNHANAGYSLEYIKVPVDISSSVQPITNEVAHDAIVERACWIILKDRENEQANIHLRMYGTLLQGLMK